MAERVVAGFGDDLNGEKFPIVCICVKPLMQKFADEVLAMGTAKEIKEYVDKTFNM